MSIFIMIELVIDSVTLNSIGLLVLGLGFVASHFKKHRKPQGVYDLVLKDSLNESRISLISKYRYLFIGLGFISAAAFWGLKDYQKSEMASNYQLIQETLFIVESQGSMMHKNEAVRIMEEEISMATLERLNKRSINAWYDSNQLHNALEPNVSIDPICVKLYEIYEGVRESEKLEGLDRAYSDFFKDFWGDDIYERKRKIRFRRLYRAKQSRRSAKLN